MLKESKITFLVLDSIKNLLITGRSDEVDAMNLPPSVRYLVEHLSYHELWEFAMQNPYAIKVDVNKTHLNAMMQFDAENPNATADEFLAFVRQLHPAAV